MSGRAAYWRARAAANRVSHLSWNRICRECSKVFPQRRAGRPRLVCSHACELAAKRRKWKLRPLPCVTCGRRHKPLECGAGFFFCPTLKMHFRPAEQLALLGK